MNVSLFRNSGRFATIVLLVVFCSGYIVINLLSPLPHHHQKHQQNSIAVQLSSSENGDGGKLLPQKQKQQLRLPSILTSTTVPLLTMCQDPPPDLIGRLNVTTDEDDVPTIEEIIAKNPRVKPGGRYQPDDCLSIQSRVAIIVPYRDRDVHLRIFLNHMHPILQRQQLNYVIIVVEQAGNDTFNKALLMNIAFKESLKIAEQDDVEQRIECYIFHDVDLLTEDDRGLYACRDKPTHFSEYLNHLNYEPYIYVDVLFGGVVALQRRHFEIVNGYSNVYFGWGAEDEDMRRRLGYARIPIIKAEKHFYRYKMIQHGVDKGNPHNERRVDLLYNATRRMHHDGLNSLTYRLLKRSDLQLYTHLLVEFNQDDVLKASES